MSDPQAALVWFRRDLRDFDHAALSTALARHVRVYCAFVFDREILDALPSRSDRRVGFIHASLAELDAALDARARAAGDAGSGLWVRHGRAVEEIPRLAAELGVGAVYANRDYEPAAIARDRQVAERLAALGCRWVDCKDQVIFERDEVLTQQGRPFSVFTPYKNAWRAKLQARPPSPWPVAVRAGQLAPVADSARLPELAAIGFDAGNLAQIRLPTGMSGGRVLLQDFVGRIARYKDARDFPAKKGVSYLSTHLRFGTVSIRELVALAWQDPSPGAQCWLDELIWREFYQMILWHHPQVVEHCFRPEYDRLRWDDAPELFAAWCEARTGYPLVDAAMRQLLDTGYMHNRLRMVTASFLTKDLGIDWRLGEGFFAQHLNDYDLAANNGGWQWAASTGCDAQPWFRIFNPVTQSEKFDPEGRFIRKYLPQLEKVPLKLLHAPWKMSAADQSAARMRLGADYPLPVVDHAKTRERTLARFEAIRPQSL